MNNNTKMAIAAAFVSALVLATIPSSLAQGTGGFGRVVSASTPDSTYVLSAMAGTTAFCYVDSDGSGGFNPTEPVYLDAGGCGAASLAAGDVRIANPTTGAVGSQVTGTDSDVGRTTAATGHAAAFFDANGDGRFGTNDVLYGHVGAIPGTVAIGDIVLSGSNAGQVVGGSTPGLNNAVVAGGGSFDFFNADNSGLAGVNTYSLGDLVYYNHPGALSPADTFVSVGDVQISVGAPGGFGTVQTAAHGNTVYDLTAGGPAAFCYIDTDGSGGFSPTEPVYLQAGCAAALVAGNVRIANPTVGVVGSQVTGTDSDVGRTTAAALGSTIMFFDSNGDGRFSATGNDVLYANIDGAGTVVAIGDIVLSGTNAGQVVGGSTPGLNNALGGAGTGTMSFFNADNNGGYSLGDVLVYDNPGAAFDDGLLGIGDVQLTVSPTGVTGSFGHVGAASDAYITYSLLAAAATDPETFCYIDTDGSGGFSPSEPVYFHDFSVSAAIKAGTIRVAGPTTGTVGSQVTGTDSDVGRTCAVAGFGTAFFFFDSNGDGRFSASGSDVLYQHPGAGTTVAIGDVVLSGSNAGQVVSGSSPGLNNALTAGAGAVAVFDQDGSGAWSLGDSLYYEGIGLAAADAFSTTGDVQLTGPAPTGGGNQPGGTTPSSSSSAPSSSSSAPSSSSSAPSSSSSSAPSSSMPPSSSAATTTVAPPPTGSTSVPPPTTSTKPQPGFELVALVAALGAALVIVRRKL